MEDEEEEKPIFQFPRKESIETLILNSGGNSCTESEQDKSGIKVLEELTESISPIPVAPELKRQNSQRRLRIASEDHKLFLSGMSADVLPFIQECNSVMNKTEDQSNESEDKVDNPATNSAQNFESQINAKEEVNLDDFWDKTNNNDVNQPQEPTQLRRKVIRVVPKISINSPEHQNQNSDKDHDKCVIT